MDAEKTAPVKLTPQQEDYLEIESTCCLCGTELVFEHNHDDSTLLLKEKAQCPCCNILLKEKEFIIH